MGQTGERLSCWYSFGLCQLAPSEILPDYGAGNSMPGYSQAIPNRHSYVESLALNTVLFSILGQLELREKKKEQKRKKNLELHNHHMEHKGDPEPALCSVNSAIWHRVWEQSLPLCHLAEWMDPERLGSWWEKSESTPQPELRDGRKSRFFMNLSSCMELVVYQKPYTDGVKVWIQHHDN